jgi:hypothetical protein
MRFAIYLLQISGFLRGTMFLSSISIKNQKGVSEDVTQTRTEDKRKRTNNDLHFV